MFEPISVGAGIVAGYAALTVYARGGTAVSSEAREGEKAANSVVERAEDSLALFGKKAAALEQLRQIAVECSAPNWSGDDAEPVSDAAVYAARSIVFALPANFPVPEVAPEPDGQISLDWIASRSRVFSISTTSSGRLAYAWIDGADQGRAVARFDYREMPPRVLAGISAIVDAPVRS